MWYRAGLGRTDIEFVAVNDITDTKTLAHLLSTIPCWGRSAWPHVRRRQHTVGGKKIKVFGLQRPGAARLTSVGAQIVIESTGRFTDAKEASKAYSGTVKKVSSRPPEE